VNPLLLHKLAYVNGVLFFSSNKKLYLIGGVYEVYSYLVTIECMETMVNPAQSNLLDWAFNFTIEFYKNIFIDK